MQEIIVFKLYSYLYNFNYKSILLDQYQYYFLSFIINPFFPWVLVVLLLNRNKLKRPVIFILVGFWVFVSIGEILGKSIDILKYDFYKYWPFSLDNWYIGCAGSYTFRLLGEIIGDWYPLLRVKAISRKKNLIIVYTTCLLFNLSKIFGISCYYIFAPKSLERPLQDNGMPKIDGFFYKKFYVTWLYLLFVMLITSILYDLSVIYYLKSNLFDKLKEYQAENKNNFIEKFKKISEFRIIISLVASFIFLPILLYFLITNIMDINGTNEDIRNKEIESKRDLVVNVNYFFMFIDQILLRFYAERNDRKYKISSTNSYIFSHKTHSSHTKSQTNTNNSQISQHSQKLSQSSLLSISSNKMCSSSTQPHSSFISIVDDSHEANYEFYSLEESTNLINKQY